MGESIFRILTEQAIKVSTMLSSYSRALAALDLCALETQVKAAKQICDRAEQAFRKKNLQKKDLVEIRQTFVDSQKQTMLDSEDEYFLMEPVDVPGIESNANFQRSLDDFTKEFEFASGAATAPKVCLPRSDFECIDLPSIYNSSFANEIIFISAIFWGYNILLIKL